MNQGTRRTRFQERVRIEREFLAPVNRHFATTAPLAGMTGPAIESWWQRASALDTTVNVDRVAGLLREAAIRAEILADESRDVFEENRRTGPDGLAELKLMLEDTLAARG